MAVAASSVMMASDWVWKPGPVCARHVISRAVGRTAAPRKTATASSARARRPARRTARIAAMAAAAQYGPTARMAHSRCRGIEAMTRTPNAATAQPA